MVSRIAYLRGLIQKLQPIPTVQVTQGTKPDSSQNEVANQLLPPLRRQAKTDQVIVVLDEAEQLRVDIREEIKLLPNDEQIALAARALSEMPSATPNMRRRASEGDWSSLPLVAAKMVDIYSRDRETT